MVRGFQQFQARMLLSPAALGGMAIAILGLGLPVLAGEYFTEETTSPSVDVVHGWQHTEGNISLSLTNSSRSQLRVPLEVSGAGNCTDLAFELNDGRTLPVGSFENCSIGVFPYLDRMINQEIAALLLSVDGQLLEIPTTADDRLAIAQVANESRDAYILFQQEVAKAVAYYQANPPANAPPESGSGAALNSATAPPPVTSSAPVQTNPAPTSPTATASPNSGGVAAASTSSSVQPGQQAVASPAPTSSQPIAEGAPAAVPPAVTAATPSQTAEQQAISDIAPVPSAPVDSSPSQPSRSQPTGSQPSASPVASNPNSAQAPAPTLSQPQSTNSAQPDLVIVGDIQEQTMDRGSLLTVQAQNTTQATVKKAQARFEFSLNDEIVDTQTASFAPGDVPPGTVATAELLKAEDNWDKVTVSFVWERAGS